MHPKDELLRALHDQELPRPQARQVEEHLSGCPTCQERLDAIARRAGRVQSRINSLTPGPGEQPSASHAAYRRFVQSRFSNQHRKDGIQTMFKSRPLWTAVIVIALLAIVFTLPPTRAWASTFLRLFRVEKVQVITFDPAAARANRAAFEDNRAAFETIFDENMEIEQHGESFQVASAAEAADRLGSTPRLPETLTGARLTVKPGMNAVFTIDQPKLQELADAMGADLQLAPAVDGQVITMDVSNGLVASTCEEDEDSPSCVTMIQIPSPSINAPDDLDMPAIGSALFQFLGLSADEANLLSQRIDWTNTLIIPIPTGENISAKDVAVDGTQGNLFIEQESGRYFLLWVKDNIIYSLSAPGGESEALQTAGTLR